MDSVSIEESKNWKKEGKLCCTYGGDGHIFTAEFFLELYCEYWDSNVM